MAAFDWADWGARVRANFPRPWAGQNLAPNAWTVDSAPDANGRLGSLVYGLTGGLRSAPSGLPFLYSQQQYVRAQMRLATISDSNVDQLGLDWFGGVVPRANGEPDRAYASRLVLTLTAGAPSIPGLTKILQAYINASYQQTTSAPLAADITGGADVGAGGADVGSATASATPPALGSDVGVGGADVGGTFTDVRLQIGGAPSVIIFDVTSDPTTSALISLADPQFCVFLAYTNSSASLIQAGNPYDEVFAGMVQAFSHPGTIPVYATDQPT